MKEAVLRDDFRFSEYLGMCFFKTMQEVLQLRLSTLITFLIFLAMYSIIRLLIPEHYEILAMFLVSVAFFLFHLGLKIMTEKIFS